MTNTTPSQPIDMNGVISNTFGEHSLFSINRNLFQDTDASTVFRAYFGESLFEENTFYIITGTDSGLLYQYVKSHNLPEGSHYLFVELPQVLKLFTDMDDPEAGVSVTDDKNWQQRANDMDMLSYAIQERLVLIRSLGVVHGHCDDYSPFFQQIRKEYDAFMDKQRIALNSQPFIVRQIDNLSENQIPAICLKGLFSEKTAVVLAGGPSLDELLPWVRQNRQNLLVISVSRISNSLLQADIQPDIIVSVDPYPINLYVSQDMLKFQDHALLVNEFHLSSNLLSSWGGKKIFLGKRFPWPTPLEPENLPRTIGNTVTNSAIAIAVETGVAQIVLGGADFCFSQKGYTHANGSAEHALGPRPLYGSKRVTTNNGRMADTTNAFMNSAEIINIQAGDAMGRECLMINPAPGAIRLSNVEHLPLEIIQIEPLEQPAQEIISAGLPATDKNAQIQRYKEDLSEIDRMLEELRSIKELSGKALKYNRRFFNKEEKGNGAHNGVKLDRIEKQFKEKYADTTSLLKNFGIHRLILILRHSEQHKDDLEENSRLYYQAMVDTADELTSILQRARNRILCRQEENKTNPDMKRLFSQWHNDQQPGRAIQWAQHNVETVKQLPEALQQELHAFQNSFDESTKELGELYLMDIEKGINLDGSNAKAREYFQCRDKEGLLDLLAGLNAHREPKQAELFIPLIQGYLAELRDEPEAAIEAHQNTREGPARIDALMRLFELYSKSEDLKSAVEILNTLSDISSTYSPMYADLLQATGEVDTAVEIYTDYLLKNPDDLNSMMKLGKIFYQHGSVEGVEWTMNYILGKDAYNEAAKAMLRSLNQSQTTIE